MKSKISGLLFITLCVFFLDIKFYGQFIADDKTAAVSAVTALDLKVKEKAENSKNILDFYQKTPVVLRFINGNVIKGYLIANPAQDPDTILVEVQGKYKNFNLDEVLSIALASRWIDSFGLLANNDIKARIDSFLIALQNEPNATGVIIYYTGRNGNQDFLTSKENVINGHFAKKGFDRNRVSHWHGGDCGKNMLIQLWLVPAGSPGPTPDCSR